ncbi:MAG: hypothetical protein ACQEXJ_09855 [Myxococcota bacterium]
MSAHRPPSFALLVLVQVTLASLIGCTSGSGGSPDVTGADADEVWVGGDVLDTLDSGSADDVREEDAPSAQDATLHDGSRRNDDAVPDTGPTCTPQCDGLECGDDGCGGSCGTCPEVAPYCIEGLCAIECTLGCSGAVCGDDGCGGSCGTCPDGTTCAAGDCICEPHCDSAECGTDGCGGSCGSCPTSTPYCVEGTCAAACSPDCDSKECGADGCGGSCGTCPQAAPYCVADHCTVECVPSCEGATCGPDGCGGTCGSCDEGSACVGGQCYCVADCAGSECGPNGCGGTCGECPSNAPFCTGGQCEAACEPGCADKECGDDGCGGTCGTCPESTTCDDVGTCVSTEPGPGIPYASAEPLVRVLGPDPKLGSVGWGRTTGHEVVLDGVLFGDVSALTWSGPNGNTGSIDVGASWSSEPIPLQMGDNEIVIEAWDESVARDRVTVVRDPTGAFAAAPRAAPDVLWVGEKSDIRVTVRKPEDATWTPDTVRLVHAAGDGPGAGTDTPMKDSGTFSGDGDAVKDDGEFSTFVSLACDAPGTSTFRVHVTAEDAQGQPYEARSAPVTVSCYEHVTPDQLETAEAVIEQAETALLEGSAQQAVISDLLESPSVTAAGPASGDGFGLWLQLEGGLLGAVFAAPAGTRSTAVPGDAAPALTLGNRRAMMLAPHADEFGDTDDGPDAGQIFASSLCPPFQVAADGALADSDASLDRFRRFDEYGVVSVSAHGEALFQGLPPEVQEDLYAWRHTGSQEVVSTGEAIAPDTLLQAATTCTVLEDGTNDCPLGTRCVNGEVDAGVCVDDTQADLRAGRVVVTNLGYAVTPAFFRHHARARYPRSLVNLGACRTLFDGSLASTFLGLGAATVTGFTGYVESLFAREHVLALFDGAIQGGSVAQSHSGASDPDWPGSHWALVGDTDLDLSWSGLLSPDFEAIDVHGSGWTVEGDGRLVSALGSATAPSGDRMALVSTGLGHTVQSGLFSQTFCPPDEATGLSMSWRFYSEEFKEFCGSEFQDSFVTQVEGPDEDISEIEIQADDLCPPNEGSCGPCVEPTPCASKCMAEPGCYSEPDTGLCVGEYQCTCGRYASGLTPSDVDFDQGGVFHTEWREFVLPLGDASEPGPITLRFMATDTGDSIFDTVVLVDDVTPCAPDCTGKECGDDGCGGTCGACASDDVCIEGACCTPSCLGKACGGDGCGGSCGTCDDANACTLESCVDGACYYTPDQTPGCCGKAADCQDDDPCTLDVCEDFECAHPPVPDEEQLACDDGDPCTLDDTCASGSCVGGPLDDTCCAGDEECDDGDDVCTEEACIDGHCSYSPTGVEGCCEVQPVTWTFEQSPPFTFTATSAPCGWQIAVTYQSTSGVRTLYYGDPADDDYDCGVNAGTATSPLVELPAGAAYALSFDLLMDTQPDADLDRLTVRAVAADGSYDILLWGKSALETGTQWHTYQRDISALAGTAFRLVFDFDTVGGTANDGLGVFVDDVVVGSSCVPAPCTSNEDCHDGLAETLDACTPTGCAWQFE